MAGTIVWGVIGFIILWIFTLPRTLKKVSYLSIVCKSVFQVEKGILLTHISIRIHMCRRIRNNDRCRRRP